jgi:Holliday junction resolvase-like predicted endonuclease
MLTENDVVDAVARHLTSDGWNILQTRTTLQQGIDILAQKDNETLAIEAKGGGSAREGNRALRPTFHR